MRSFQRWLTPAVFATVGLLLVACDPAPPIKTQAPVPQVTVTVPASWHIPRPAEGCPATWTDPTNPSRHQTFDGNDWNTFVAGLTAQATLKETTIKFPTGCYYLGSTLRFDDVRTFEDVVIDGNAKGAWITQTWLPVTTTMDPVMHLAAPGSTRVTIQGLRVVGSAPPDVSTQPYPARSDEDLGLAVSAGTDVTVADNEISQTWSDPIYVSDVTRALVSGNVLYYSGRNGLAIANGSDVHVTGNLVFSVALMGIDLEPNPPVSKPLTRVQVDHNHIENVDDSAYRSTRGNGAMVNITAFAPVSNVWIDSNTSSQAQLNIVLQGSSPIDNVRITNNTTNDYRGSINIAVGTQITVSDNSLTTTATGATVNTRWAAGTCGGAARNIAHHANGTLPFANLGGPTAC